MKAKHCVILATAVIVMILAAYELAAIQAGPTDGTLKIMIKDAPVNLSKLDVTIDSLEVQSQEGSWINIPFNDGVQFVKFDLLSLQDVSLDLATTQIPIGSYNKIRLHVSEAIATYNDGTTEDLKVPSDKIDVIIDFEVKEEVTTNVLIDMTADFVAISNTHNLRPVLKATQLPSETPNPNPSIPDASLT
jgi:hypothetical protein